MNNTSHMATGMTGYGGGVTFGMINSTLNQMVQSADSSLSTQLTTISQKANPSSTDMLSLQQALENYTVVIEASATTTKDFYDALKEVIQKAA